MDELNIQILKALAKEKTITSTELGDLFSLSGKTIRKRLQEISEALPHNTAKLISKPGIGFSLDVLNESAFDHFIAENKEMNTFNPQTKEGRINFIINYLLLNDDYVNLSKMSELLYVSRSTLSNDMVTIKSFFAEYHLKVMNYKSKGIKLSGKEKDIRRCLSQLHDENKLFELFGGHEVYLKISEILQKLLYQYDIRLSDLNFQNLCNHMYILIERNKNKKPQDEFDFDEKGIVLDEKLIGIAEKIGQKINELFDIELSSGEINYIAIHLGGKQYLTLSDSQFSLLEETKTYKVVNDFLETIYSDWNIDLRADNQLISNLVLHFKPMIIRLSSGFEQKNPMLGEIKEHLSFAYLLTAQSIHTVENEIELSVSPDEISYISLHINLAIKRKIEDKEKKNIIIICNTGMTSSKMLANIIMDRFSRYINKIATDQINNLNQLDLAPYDLIITTTDKTLKTLEASIPQIKVNYFLDEQDLLEIEKHLTVTDYESIQRYFDPNLFILCKNLGSKEQVISEMVTQIKKSHNITDDFYELILKREKNGATDFKNLIALPHPEKLVTDKTIVAVAVLDTPIIWDTEKVQVVVLISAQKKFNTELNQFYKVMSKFIASEIEVKKLIKHKDYTAFMKQIEKIEDKLFSSDNPY